MFYRISELPFVQKIEKLGRAHGLLPFPRNSDFIPAIRSCLKSNIVTVLDVGCGRLWESDPASDDYLLTLFSSPLFHVTGVDILPECVRWRQENGPPGEYVCMDALNIGKLDRKFDLVILHHVIEHFGKELARTLVLLAESLALEQVVVGAPIGFTDTAYAVSLHNNPYELHRSGWLPSEFVAMGYKVVYVFAGAFLAVKNTHQRQLIWDSEIPGFLQSPAR